MDDNKNTPEITDSGLLDKEYWLSTWALNNKISVIIMTLLIALGGLIAYSSMPKELYPEIVMPQIYVRTVYPGNSPLDIENLITRVLEKEIKPVKGINEMSSTSVQDNSIIIVEFNTDVPVEEALKDVKDAVDKAKTDLPNDLDIEPIVMDINMSEMPVMNINLSGDYSVDDLKEHAEYLQEKLEVIPQLSSVDLRGGLDREINIMVDQHRMELVQVSFTDIESAIGYENMNISGGDILMDGSRRNIRVAGEYENMDDLMNTIIKAEFGNLVYLRDVATVADSYKERTSYARLDGDPVVSLDIVKKSGENLLIATEQIEKILAEVQEHHFPSDLKVTITNDQSDQVRGQLLNLENNIFSGVILVVLILLFYLGVRNALFVGIAIPMSMLMSFIILNMLNVTINMMVLFALILALGMLVDNGIVTIENIYRFYSNGRSADNAAKFGVGEIAVPIISSTATTLAAFFPLLFWDSIMGEFMKFLPITLIAVMGSSLFVALVVNPVLASIFIKTEGEVKLNLKRVLLWVGISTLLSVLGYVLGNFTLGTMMATVALITLINAFFFRPASNKFQKHFLPWQDKAYERFLSFALTGWKPILFFLGTGALLVFSIVLLGIVKPEVEFFPNNEPKYINVFVEVPIGTDIEKTNESILQIEADIDKILVPYLPSVNSVVTNIGEGATDPTQGPPAGETPNKARITISFKEFELREGILSSEVMKDLAQNLPKHPGVIVSVEKNNDGPPTGKPINIEVSGEDYTKLMELSDDITSKIEAARIPGIEGLKTDLETGKPELLVHVDRTRARRFGLSTAQIGSTIRTALFGKEVSKFKDGEDEFPMMLRLKDTYRYDVSTLLNQKITFRDMTDGRIKQIPISSVADISYSSSFGAVKRKDQNRTVTIYSNVLEGYNETEINAQIQAQFANYAVPEGYTVSYTGKAMEQDKAQAFLFNAFIVAIFLITLILVSQFNSVIKPFIIMATVLFSTIGVFLGVAIFGMKISVIMTGIGIVSLAGVVVNNAIVLIDYIDLTIARRKEELDIPKEQDLPLAELIGCIVHSGRTRLRPVLLTAITTVLGLVPLAVGLNINFYTLMSDLDPQIYLGGDNVAFWGPLSWTVIFGLTFATFLTLVLVPVMYLLVERIRMMLFKKGSSPVNA
jgi:multidrug efflux pump subunit AcrB